MIKPYRAVCMQTYSRVCNVASDRAGAWKIIKQNLDRACEVIDGLLGAGGRDIKLMVFPEFNFQGYPLRESAAEWIEKACYEVPGPITDVLAQKAKQYGIYIGGNHYERDEEWPGRYFNCSFVINPQGEVILRYRRINSVQTPSPHDFMDKYFERYGIEGTFPVAKTELGNLAIMPCGEIMFPEAARMFMMRGAEVLLHPTSDAGGPPNSAWESAKIVRAAENMMYLISANSAGTIGGPIAVDNSSGGSKILDYEGRILSLSDCQGETTKASALIDIEQLRYARRTTGAMNRLLRSRFEIYRPVYNETSFYPANQFADEPMESKRLIMEIQKKALQNMVKHGASIPE